MRQHLEHHLTRTGYSVIASMDAAGSSLREASKRSFQKHDQILSLQRCSLGLFHRASHPANMANSELFTPGIKVFGTLEEKIGKSRPGDVEKQWKNCVVCPRPLLVKT